MKHERKGHHSYLEEIRLSDTNARVRAESVFGREKRREAEIADALEQEQLRHDDVIRNMQRLRDLRLSRDAKRVRSKRQRSRV
jgi:hypothetical protein